MNAHGGNPLSKIMSLASKLKPMIQLKERLLELCQKAVL